MSTGHSLLAPSSASRWMACPGSVAFNEGDSSNVWADDGTSTHWWGGLCLNQGKDAEAFLTHKVKVHGVDYSMEEARADRVQFYLDDVRRRMLGATWTAFEYHVDLAEWLGEGQGGTADATIFHEESGHVIIEDLKDGMERVDASYIEHPADEMAGTPEVRAVNPQLGLYAGGLVRDLELMGYEVKTITAVICQPKLNHIDEFTLSYAELMEFMDVARLKAEAAMIAYQDQLNIDAYCNPGEKQCRWCARVGCPSRDEAVEKAVRAEFEDIPTLSGGVPVPEGIEQLERAMLVVPFIEDWCKAVRKKVEELVDAGTRVNGPDGLPYKFVEGKGGKRAWSDPKAAEALLVGQLGPKAYAPQQIITAPAADKLLNRKQGKVFWEKHFVPLIKKGSPSKTLALGSDTRPVWVGAADADDFEEIADE